VLAKGRWTESRRLKGGAAVLTMGRSRERQRVALSVQGGQVWRLRSLEKNEALKQLLMVGDLSAIAVSPEEQAIAVSEAAGRDGIHTITILEMAAVPQRVREDVVSVRAPVRALALTSTGVLLAAVGLPFDSAAKLDTPRALFAWDAATGRVRWRVDKMAPVGCLAVSDDERLVAAGTGAGEVFIANVMVGPDGEVRDLRGAGAERTEGGLTTHGAHAGAVKAVAFSPDATRLYTLAEVNDVGELRAFSVRDGRELRTPVTCARPGATLDVSPDGSLLLLSTREGRVEVWSAGE
jgi:hypothetical protein